MGGGLGVDGLTGSPVGDLSVFFFLVGSMCYSKFNFLFSAFKSLAGVFPGGWSTITLVALSFVSDRRIVLVSQKIGAGGSGG